MLDGHKFLAIIPARGGSKGIPNKNIIEIDSKPLIAYTIEESKKSGYLDKIIVSTDSQKIQQTSLKYGAEVPFLRPNILANDTSKTIEAVIFTINELKKLGEFYDYVLVLQPTQPLRRSKHIDDVIRMAISNSLTSITSVSKVTYNPLLIREVSTDNSLVKLLESRSDVRRQDFSDYYKINGAVYLNAIDDDLNLSTSLNDNQYGYIMSSEFDLDIDTFEDIQYFKELVLNEKIPQ